MHLFNVAGYSLVFNYLIADSEVAMVNQIDLRNYADDELIEVKTSLHLPYYTGSSSYERTDGEIELNGVHYNYVKRKVSNDTLYLICIRNNSKTELLKNRSDYSGKVTDAPGNNESGKSSIKKINAEYNQPANEYRLVASPLIAKQKLAFFAVSLHDNVLDENFRPPRVDASVLIA